MDMVVVFSTLIVIASLLSTIFLADHKGVKIKWILILITVSMAFFFISMIYSVIDFISLEDCRCGEIGCGECGEGIKAGQLIPRLK